MIPKNNIRLSESARDSINADTRLNIDSRKDQALFANDHPPNPSQIYNPTHTRIEVGPTLGQNDPHSCWVYVMVWDVTGFLDSL